MGYSQHSHTVGVRLDVIRDNYRRLCAASSASGADSLAPASLPACPGAAGELGQERELVWPQLIPVIKADAYGHGHIPVARALQREGASLFASGSVREAVALRRGLQREGAAEEKAPGIIALLGVMDFEDARLAAENGVIPVIHCFEQLALLERYGAPLAVALKCNSGMNRLGFEKENVNELTRALAAMPYIRPVLALSHLASADTDAGKQAAHSQAVLFAEIMADLRKVFPSLAASLANTAGTLLSSEIETALGPHICRPGIGLYGGNPFYGTSLEELGADLAPAMSVRAPLIATRDLPMGMGIGYGHAFRATRNMRVGIAAAGYADMFPRFMSNRGQVCVLGGRAPVLGRVSMQMIAIDLEECEGAKAGDDVWLLGGPYEAGLGVQELASLWDSISYEVFCLLGHGDREYEGEARA